MAGRVGGPALAWSSSRDRLVVAPDGGGRRVCHGAPATSAPVDHASRTGADGASTPVRSSGRPSEGHVRRRSAPVGAGQIAGWDEAARESPCQAEMSRRRSQPGRGQRRNEPQVLVADGGRAPCAGDRSRTRKPRPSLSTAGHSVPAGLRRGSAAPGGRSGLRPAVGQQDVVDARVHGRDLCGQVAPHVPDLNGQLAPHTALEPPDPEPAGEPQPPERTPGPGRPEAGGLDGRPRPGAVDARPQRDSRRGLPGREPEHAAARWRRAPRG